MAHKIHVFILKFTLRTLSLMTAVALFDVKNSEWQDIGDSLNFSEILDRN